MELSQDEIRKLPHTVTDNGAVLLTDVEIAERNREIAEWESHAIDRAKEQAIAKARQVALESLVNQFASTTIASIESAQSVEEVSQVIDSVVSSR